MAQLGQGPLSLTRNLTKVATLPEFQWQMAELVSRLEDYLNGKVDIFIIESKGLNSKKARPTFKKDDLVFDLTTFPGIATLQQWDGEKLVSLGFQTIVGPLPQIYNETPSGVQDGSNTTFNTSSKYALKTTRLYLNGQRLKRGSSFDYNESSNQKTITFISIIPIVTDTIIIDYNTQ